jgi:enoyl-CoA hydratase/carnithine racemase
MEQFEAIVSELETNPALRALVIISGKPDNFIAGADINMLDSVTTEAGMSEWPQPRGAPWALP